VVIEGERNRNGGVIDEDGERVEGAGAGRGLRQKIVRWLEEVARSSIDS
jgi:hypothetical protein